MPHSLNYTPTFAERYPVALATALVDAGIAILAAYLAFFLRFDKFDLSSFYLMGAITWASLVVSALFIVGAYGSWRGQSFLRQVARVGGGWLLAAAVLSMLSFFLKTSTSYSRLWAVYTVLITIGIGTSLRLLVFLALRQARRAGRNLKQILAVLPTEARGQILPSTLSLRAQGYAIASILECDEGADWLRTLPEQADASKAHEVWLMLPLSEGGHIQSAVYALRHHVVSIRFLPQLNDLPLLNHQVSRIAGFYSIDLSMTPMDGVARILKRTEDLVLGSLIFLLILPVCIAIALAIKLTSPGPILFKQYRTGINGQRFKVYKFRSMIVHKESSGTVTQAKLGDPRITKLGAFLRRTSLDELPQFFNVLQGRMSIVGPRPHALAHNEYYKDLVESYMQRHQVKPGITGWAQVNGLRGETDTLEKMKARVEHDLWYIDNWSLWLDFKIILLTTFKGFRNPNAY
ncbi:undecaprenyl-phosphate glucose phosphotransferase [Pseudothauera nasutitermitis]|uniref:Undecaprenyl-phosphate glucose phosphotransferase n=1 Tax=Pseudothauera nasutitermitis TaxID=2565930 RepID=A0A4S4AV57_9RHOO|nr:undecaprenyl-phosphate glucose phosphotransferase [Pseudothauera nasutitermitis]THF63111.1 undecaprenyl-phosphate glucose phosphotransferase [Pseudothauera nasutitermitis]